jgi:hypothetical protein
MLELPHRTAGAMTSIAGGERLVANTVDAAPHFMMRGGIALIVAPNAQSHVSRAGLNSGTRADAMVGCGGRADVANRQSARCACL